MAEFRLKNQAFKQTVRRWSKKWGHTERPLRVIGQYITEISKQAFDDESDPRTGASWPSLSPVYAAYKRKKRRSRTMLVFTARLKRSVGYAITIPRVIIGPSVHYGIYHQFGGGGMSLGRSGGSAQSLPARPFLGLSKTHERELQGMIAKFVKGERG